MMKASLVCCIILAILRVESADSETFTSGVSSSELMDTTPNPVVAAASRFKPSRFSVSPLSETEGISSEGFGSPDLSIARENEGYFHRSGPTTFVEDLRKFDSVLRGYVNETSYDYPRFARDYDLRESEFQALKIFIDIIRKHEENQELSKFFDDVEFHFKWMELHFQLNCALLRNDYSGYSSREVAVLSTQLLEFDISLSALSDFLSQVKTCEPKFKAKYFEKVRQFAELKMKIENMGIKDNSLAKRIASISSYLESIGNLVFRAERLRDTASPSEYIGACALQRVPHLQCDRHRLVGAFTTKFQEIKEYLDRVTIPEEFSSESKISFYHLKTRCDKVKTQFSLSGLADSPEGWFIQNLIHDVTEKFDRLEMQFMVIDLVDPNVLCGLNDRFKAVGTAPKGNSVECSYSTHTGDRDGESRQCPAFMERAVGETLPDM